VHNRTAAEAMETKEHVNLIIHHSAQILPQRTLAAMLRALYVETANDEKKTNSIFNSNIYTR
jgi:hypothetical protein